jgi:hypothetical protein
VKVYRNCLPFDAPASCESKHGHSLVFVGDAAFLEGARPDVEAAFPTQPLAYRAGWGYLMLSNMLPNVPDKLGYGGQGPLTLYAIATDVEGKTTLLGRSQGDSTPTRITMANASIGKPFGAIDTPGQGQTVSGPLANFGWVLTRDTDTVVGNGDVQVPTDGSTIGVFLDGVKVGQVTYNQCRGDVGNPVPAGLYCNDDVANIFGNPTPQPTFGTRTVNPTVYRNLDVGRAAIGSFDIDTTTLANGMHTIAWGVTDSAGRVEGIGSRFFTVLNSGADVAARPAAGDVTSSTADLDAARIAPAMARGAAADLDALAVSTAPVSGRTGFDSGAPLEAVPADADGVRRIRVAELGRVELACGPVDRGYLVANGTLRDLPPGSHLETVTGTFTWAPGPGYVGTYRLVFLRGGEQVPVEVTIAPVRPPAAGESEIRLHVDEPTAGASLTGGVRVAGWALDPQAAFGSGIGAVHVWAQRTDVPGTTAVFLGAADLAGARPDVAVAFGRQFEAAGFGLTAAALPPGAYDVTVYAWNVRTGRWEDARTVSVAVR